MEVMTMRMTLIAVAGGFSLVFSSLASAATYDLGGQWEYAFSDKTVDGACPLGPLNTGTLEITQEGDTATLEILTGGECSPASMCSYECTIADDVYTCSSSDTVDDEGGVAENTFTLTASSETEASGPAVSTYTLGTFQCRWDYTVTMTRSGGGSGSEPESGSSSDGCTVTGRAPAGGLPLLALAALALVRSLPRRRR
jgi:MYXO-CTERM domain-containing protein